MQWTALIALLPVLFNVAMEVFKQENDVPTPGQGETKKKNLIGRILDFLMSALASPILKNNQDPTVKLASKVTDAVVEWANDTGAFKK